MAGLPLESCKKESTEDPPSKHTLLTQNNWYIVALLARDSASGAETDLFPLFPDCEKDNITRFQEDNNIIINEGEMTCNPNDSADVFYGYWYWRDDYAKIEIIRDNQSKHWWVDQLNDTALTLRYSVVENGMDRTVLTTHYRAIR